MKKSARHKRIKDAVFNHISNNIREYVIVTIIFLIGIVVGVIVVNNSSNMQKEELNSYIGNFVNSIRDTGYTIDKSALLKETIKSNLLLVFLLWFMGSTVIGIPIVYAIIAYKGFSLSYTISALIAILGGKGIGVVFSSLFIQSIIFIPTMFALAVSGIRLHKSIMKDKRKENIKLEICRHSVLSILTAGVMILVAFIEVYISTAILENYIKIL